MTHERSTRREFLWQAGLASSLSMLGGAPLAAADETPKSSVLVRKDIATLAPDGPEIAALRRGIKVMKSRPVDDPLSFIYQANMHLTYDKPARPEWNHCPHGNFFWLPWHRLYIYYFERILRAAAEEPTLTLPYWNYANPNARALPLPFRQPADDSNSLYVRERNPDGGGVNNGAQLPGSAVGTLYRSFEFTNFSSPHDCGIAFAGQVADKPLALGAPQGEFEIYHTLVHVLVGGEGGWLSDLFMAGRDPIFFLHHANIDRLWKRWLEQGGGRANPVDNKTWMDTKFTFFDEKGKKVEISTRECLDDVNQLGYRYDDDPPDVPRRFQAAAPVGIPKPLTRCASEVAASTNPPVVMGPEPLRFTIDLKADARKEIDQALAAGSDTLLLLNVDIAYEKEPMLFYEIYLNLPADVKEPDWQSIYYVGNLCFPATVPHKHGKDKDKKEAEAHVGTRSLPINDIVAEQKARKRWTDEKASVTLVMRSVVPLKDKKTTAKPDARTRLVAVSISTM